MRSIVSDLRITLRKLRRSSGFAATAVLMLAFGIGATTAIFSVVDCVLLRPLAFPDSDRLVTLGDQVSGTDWGHQDAGPVTGPEVIIYPRETRSFQSLGGFGDVSLELSGVGEPARVNGTRMTPAVFSALAVPPLMGRVFSEQEDQQKALVAVLSYATWKIRFQGNAHILGTRILLDRKPYLVIGVMPRTFEFPLYPGQLSRSEIWIPMSLSAHEVAPAASTSWYLQLVGRLKPGVSPAQAQADAESVAQHIMSAYPPDMRNFRIRPVVYPLQQITILQARPLLRVLFLAVAVVLLIACANLTGLLLVRAIGQQRETAVRLAVGAPAITLLRQMMLESLTLNFLGGLAGIGLAALALTAGKSFLPETLPRIDEISLNWTIAGFALLLSGLTGLFCGLAPGFAAIGTNVNAALKEGGRAGTASGSHARLRSMLVIGEIATALVLLSASGLLLRSFRNMSTVDLGFRPEHVTTTAYALPHNQYPTQRAIDEFNRRLLQQLRQQAGVEAVGLSSTLPTTGDGIEAFTLDGYVDPRGPDRTEASPSQVIGDFFPALGIRLIRGRYFNESDDADHQLVAIVNREFAEHYWGHQDPIGKRMRIGTLKSATPWITIAGEVADTKLTSPDADASEQFYLPSAQIMKDDGAFASPTDLNGNGGYIVLRSALPSEQMESRLRATVRSIDPQLPLASVQTMGEVVSQSEAPRRFNTVMIAFFAVAAVLLAVLGIYSIIAFSVAARVQEMAIRMALGSQRSQIMRLVFLSGLKLTLPGCLLGLAAAAAASRLLQSLLFQVSPFDPIVMMLATIAILAVALAASAIPARRAASVNPLQALRGE